MIGKPCTAAAATELLFSETPLVKGRTQVSPARRYRDASLLFQVKLPVQMILPSSSGCLTHSRSGCTYRGLAEAGGSSPTVSRRTLVLRPQIILNAFNKTSMPLSGYR